MFLKTSRSGYDQNGEQFVRGSFLILFSHNNFKWGEETGRPWSECPYTGHELYACVRHVSLRQFGHWMMGTARIAGQSLTLSGSYGSDGLPCDYEKLSEAARAKLIRVPEDIEAIYWKGDGWNSSGSEGPDLRRWAKQQFGK